VHPLASTTYRAASADAVARLGTGNDNTKRGRGGSKKEKELESYFSKKPREAVRRATFEHRHHRKAPAALAGP
jgi:hypothetical protein